MAQMRWPSHRLLLWFIFGPNTCALLFLFHSVESTKGPLPLKAILILMSVPFLYEGGVPSARIKSGIVFGPGL